MSDDIVEFNRRGMQLFDNGEFELLEEPLNADIDSSGQLREEDDLHFSGDRIQWTENWSTHTRSDKGSQPHSMATVAP